MSLAELVITSVKLEGRSKSEVAVVPPTRQYTNPNVLVSGLEVTVKAVHAKVRRDGYRRA